ncbi:MAG: cadherin repeat domain-containing protein, partial [Planctomycetota bacterium]
AENSTAVTTLVADTDAGESVTYSIAGGADAALFSIDPATGVLIVTWNETFNLYGDSIKDASGRTSPGISTDTNV